MSTAQTTENLPEMIEKRCFYSLFNAYIVKQISRVLSIIELIDKKRAISGITAERVRRSLMVVT